MAMSGMVDVSVWMDPVHLPTFALDCFSISLDRHGLVDSMKLISFVLVIFFMVSCIAFIVLNEFLYYC